MTPTMLKEKNKIIVGAVIVIILAVVGYFVFAPRSKPVYDSSSSSTQNMGQLQNNPQTASPATAITELIVEDISVGNGPAVKKGDTISINYLGTLTDGKKFDSSYDRGKPFETQIGMGQVIEGWDVGVIGMQVGGKRKLLIPSAMAYGAQGISGVIPPNAPLIFEVELVAIK